MDYNLLGSSVLGVLQARILEWVVIPFSEGSSQPGSGTWVSCIAGRFFTREAGNLYHIEFSYLLNGSNSFWREDLKDDFPKRNEGRKALECFSEYVIQKLNIHPWFCVLNQSIRQGPESIENKFHEDQSYSLCDCKMYLYIFIFLYLGKNTILIKMHIHTLFLI